MWIHDIHLFELGKEVRKVENTFCYLKHDALDTSKGWISHYPILNIWGWKVKVSLPGARFSKVPITFGPEKSIVKVRPACSVKLVFSYVVKGIKIKNKCKVSCLETPSFWRYKENYVTRNTPEKFRDFRETGPRAPFVSLDEKIRKNENFTSSFGRLRQKLHQKACCTCSTIIFSHSGNQIIHLWRCRSRCCRHFLKPP